MSKSVLISIRPKWVGLIASGRKTVEVRKTRPRLETPFRCYIYQTLPKWGDWNERDGRVIGEFVCDDVFMVWPGYAGNCGDDCLSFDEREAYLGDRMGYGWHISELKIYDKPRKLGEFRRWCEPGGDRRPCQNGKYCHHIRYDYLEDCQCCAIDFDGSNCPFEKVQRPPQSWCYVEKVAKGDGK